MNMNTTVGGCMTLVYIEDEQREHSSNNIIIITGSHGHGLLEGVLIGRSPSTRASLIGRASALCPLSPSLFVVNMSTLISRITRVT